MEFQFFLNFTKKIKKIIKMLLHFWLFTCCPYPFSFQTSLFIKRPYVSLDPYSQYVQNVNFGKNIWIHTSKRKNLYIYIYIYIYTHFKLLSWDEVFTCLFFFFSSWDEISSRQKRVNSKRHFTIDGDDFIPG